MVCLVLRVPQKKIVALILWLIVNFTAEYSLCTSFIFESTFVHNLYNNDLDQNVYIVKFQKMQPNKAKQNYILITFYELIIS